MAGRSRLGPDPTVQVGDLQQKVWEVTQRQGCMDLAKILHSSRDQKWKTAPDQEWLGGDGLSDLMSSLFSLHTNGVLQSTKLKKALLKLQSEKGRMNCTRLHDSDWCDKMDELIRIAAGQYRTAKQDALKYSRLVKKCSIKEKKNIDYVLGFMVLAEDEVITGGDVPLEEAGESSVAAAKAEVTKPEEVVETALVVAVPKPASNVFQKVLQREASDPASPSFGLTTSSGKASKSSSSWEKPAVSKEQYLAALELAEKEEAELLNWMQESSQVEKKPKKKGQKKNKKQQEKQISATAKTKLTKKPAMKQQKPEATHKSSFLHRATSSAYHKAKNAALKLKKTREEALAAGRAASDKVSQDIQAGLLKES